MSLTNHQAVGAYQPWKPPSFDDEPEAEPDVHAATATTAPERATDPEPAPMTELEPAEPAIALPTADDIEAMYEQARQEGYAEGLKAGRAAGEKKGLEELRAQTGRIETLVAAMDEGLSRIEEDVAEELVVMAIELARQLVRHTLADHPTAVTETLREALVQLPQNAIEIHLHPDDAALIREHLADTLEHGHHRIVEDESITRGGCRLLATGSELDATIETRWRRVLEGLGRPDSNWDLEP